MRLKKIRKDLHPDSHILPTISLNSISTSIKYCHYLTMAPSDDEANVGVAVTVDLVYPLLASKAQMSERNVVFAVEVAAVHAESE